MAKKRVIKEALKRFTQRLNAAHPGFIELPSEAPWVQVFRRKLDGKAATFVVWQFHDRDDTFTLEVAWSQRGRFPDEYAYNPRQNPQPTRDGLSFRVGWFLSRKPRDFWWDITTGKDSRLTPIRSWRDEVEHPASEALDVLAPEGFLDQALDDAMSLLARGLKYVERRALQGATHHARESIRTSPVGTRRERASTKSKSNPPGSAA